MKSTLGHYSTMEHGRKEGQGSLYTTSVAVFLVFLFSHVPCQDSVLGCFSSLSCFHTFYRSSLHQINSYRKYLTSTFINFLYTSGTELCNVEVGNTANSTNRTVTCSMEHTCKPGSLMHERQLTNMMKPHHKQLVPLPLLPVEDDDETYCIVLL